ncbi:hypothetical protein AWB78_04924 [Caballeronia calidae]|uniref:Uncharacterized protein n=1 Tax=Caballeronia calidae TaxID=1777139 RepID=A0A158DAD8_9BURK|nr:hypothetical protein [Caballeronia calidae]SAK91453.1 hypothetical protein AWB78_04924 [Caballeronia calidae]
MNSPLDMRVDSVGRPVDDNSQTSDVDDEMGPFPTIIVDISDGKVLDDTDASKRLCSLEGGVQVFDRPRLETLDEVAKLLEISIEKYAVPTLSDESMTVFVLVCSTEKAVPFARFDVNVDNGQAYATLHCDDGFRQSVKRVAVHPYDDVLTLIHRIMLCARSEPTRGG